MKFKLLLIVFFIYCAVACRKKPDPVASINTGTITLSIDHTAGSEALKLNDSWYLTENKDSLQITTFKYFISNIAITASDGSVYTEEESYHLVDEEKSSSKSFLLNQVPENDYISISFLIGVDSLRNVSGAQSGDLDPSTGMFWDWNTGYIMAKLEGKSPSSTLNNDFVAYHIGGFAGPYGVLRKVTLSFPHKMILKAHSSAEIHMAANALEWFKTPNTIKIKDISSFLQADKNAALIADNYADMFTISHIE